MANHKSRRRRNLLVFMVILLVVGGLTAAAFLRKREAAITVQKEKVQRRSLVEKVVANGRIQPVLQVRISAEVSGEIIELPVKEGQAVKKGDLLVRVKPDLYTAQRRQAEAGYLSSLSGRTLAEASLRKAEQEFKRNEELSRANLISESVFMEYRTTLEIARAQVESAGHQLEVSKASLARADEDLAKTTIYSPLTGTVSKLNSELGERVVGTAMMSGTEIMTVADLNDMEARVDIGEIDIVLIALGQKSVLEVDAFRDRKFNGAVSEIANSSKGAGLATGGQSQEGTKFEVRIRVNEKEALRPGMSVTAEIETRSRTNVLAVPIQSVTTRPPKKPGKDKAGATNLVEASSTNRGSTNAVEAASTNRGSTNAVETASTNQGSTNAAGASTNGTAKSAEGKGKDRKPGEAPKPIEVVFRVKGDRAEMVPVKRGISDDAYTEIVEGIEEGQEVVSGGYKAISKDLDDGRKIRIGTPEVDKDKDKEKK